MQRVIYLDHNATTPVDPLVLEAMMPHFNTYYGNPSSNLHPQSWATAGAVKVAREQVASCLNCDASEIIFTSGATESINLALKGYINSTPEILFITSNIEHAAGSEVTLWAQKKAISVKVLEAEPNGLINLESLKIALNENTGKTVLVSLIFAHNEIGSLYSLEQLNQLKSLYNFILHLDITQAFLTETIDLQKNHIDMLSFSSHKIYGPKGVGALYLRKSTIGHQIEPLIIGGGQEYGLRSGTLNVPGIVGLGKACVLVCQNRDKNKAQFKSLFDDFFSLLENKQIVVKLNGDPDHRIFHNINITLPDSCNTNSLISSLTGFCLSQGSACGSQKTTANPTLQTIGLNKAQQQRTLRIGLGRDTKVEELQLFVEKLASIV